MKFSLILSISIFISFSAALKKYNGYKLLSVKKSLNGTQIEALLKLQKKSNLDFWNDPSPKRKTDILVPPNEIGNVEEYLEKNGIGYSVAINDIQGAVEMESRRRREGRQNSMNWNEYQKLSTINSWVAALSQSFPNLVQVMSIGRSFEGRQIRLVKLSTGGINSKKPIILIDGGIHAREWISPATVTYVMGQLIQYGKDDLDLFDLDWYIIPVVNVDGYTYTHSEDRLWRKSRSTHNGGDCIGADLNRNFDFHWAEVGVNEDPCSNTYPGTQPFSEPEANATANFILAFKDRIKAYVTMHSYSQLFLTPYGYTEDLPDDYDDLYYVGNKAAKALEGVHGTEYDVGAPSHILYSNSGSSRDWVKGVPGIKYSFTMELRDDGEHGFLLPNTEILPTAEETWEAVKVIAREVIKEQKTGQEEEEEEGEDEEN